MPPIKSTTSLPCAPSDPVGLPVTGGGGPIGVDCDNPLFVEVCQPDPVLIDAENCDGTTTQVDAQAVVVQGIVYTKECPVAKTDFEIVCASTDGRPLLAVITSDVTGAVTSVLTEVDGSAIGDGAAAAACPQSVDRETVDVCMENGAGRWSVVSFVNADDPSDVIGPVFVNPLGAIVADPGDLSPCLDAATVQAVSETIVCAGGVQLIQKTVAMSDGVEVLTYYGENGTAFSPPAAFTIGACPCAPAIAQGVLTAW